MNVSHRSSCYFSNPHYAVSLVHDSECGVSTTIETQRLSLRPVEPKDTADLAKLFGDQDVVQRFATGQTKTYEETAKRVDTWVQRWLSGDPFSALLVADKETGEPIGCVVIAHSGEPGTAELAGLGFTPFHGKKLGTELVPAINGYIRMLTNNDNYLLEGKPLTRLIATARPDNPASCKLIERLGMELVKTEEKHGALRHHYVRDLTRVA